MKSFQAQTHYELLEVSVTASAADIRNAYERLVRLYADEQVALYGLIDEDQANGLRTKLKEAFDTLADDARREVYDTSIGLPPREVKPVPRPSVPRRVEPVASSGERAGSTTSFAWGGSFSYVSAQPVVAAPAAANVYVVPQASAPVWRAQASVVAAPEVRSSAPAPLPSPAAPAQAIAVSAPVVANESLASPVATPNAAAEGLVPPLTSVVSPSAPTLEEPAAVAPEGLGSPLPSVAAATSGEPAVLGATAVPEVLAAIADTTASEARGLPLVSVVAAPSDEVAVVQTVPAATVEAERMASVGATLAAAPEELASPAAAPATPDAEGAASAGATLAAAPEGPPPPTVAAADVAASDAERAASAGATLAAAPEVATPGVVAATRPVIGDVAPPPALVAAVATGEAPAPTAVVAVQGAPDAAAEMRALESAPNSATLAASSVGGLASALSGSGRFPPVPAERVSDKVAALATSDDISRFAADESAIVAVRAVPSREFRTEQKSRPYEVPPGVEFNGDLLRQVRMARGVSLLQVSERTRIGVKHLENLEADRYDQLPATVYLRGILMNLARELGLDGLRVSKSYLAFVEAHRSKD